MCEYDFTRVNIAAVFFKSLQKPPLFMHLIFLPTVMSIRIFSCSGPARPGIINMNIGLLPEANNWERIGQHHPPDVA